MEPEQELLFLQELEAPSTAVHPQAREVPSLVILMEHQRARQ